MHLHMVSVKAITLYITYIYNAELFGGGKSISTSKTPKRPLGLSEIPTGPTRLSLDAVVQPGPLPYKITGAELSEEYLVLVKYTNL